MRPDPAGAPDLFDLPEPAPPPRLTRPCMICGAADGPFGLGMPGFRREIRAGERGMLWHCGGAPCRAAAEERRRARLGGPAATGGSASQGEAREPARLTEGAP